MPRLLPAEAFLRAGSHIAAGEETRAPTVFDDSTVFQLQDVSDSGKDLFASMRGKDQLGSRLWQVTEHFEQRCARGCIQPVADFIQGQKDRSRDQRASNEEFS